MLSLARRLFSVVAAVVFFTPVATLANDKTVLLDFGVLNNGVKLQERNDYEKLIRLDTERHGISVLHTGRPNEIKSMRALTIYMVSSAFEERLIIDAALLVDLVMRNDRLGAEERAEHLASIELIAAKCGFFRMASFPFSAKAAGRGPEEPPQLNLWRVEDPAGLQTLFANPEFAAFSERRSELHNFDKLTLFLA